MSGQHDGSRLYRASLPFGPIVGYRKMLLRIGKFGDLPSDITPHVLRHSFASFAADLGLNEPTIASLLGQKTHSITSRLYIPPTRCCWPQPVP
jgi:integrase